MDIAPHGSVALCVSKIFNYLAKMLFNSSALQNTQKVSI